MSASEWPSLDDVANITEFDTFQMRKVAQELEEYAAGFAGPAFFEGYTTGSAASVETSGNLSGQEVGEWPAARTFGQTVAGGASTDGRIAVLAQVYAEFVAQYAQVIKTIRDSAKEYDGANTANGAGNG
ncbi:hypothetical protein [Streptosporangium sp. NPDC000239]|uniref:PE domain-containing protein n=1 Tax=Streptosporangium jomthongense TaxID=1193683 RepID=A0ABV8ESF7_9ACTN